MKKLVILLLTAVIAFPALPTQARPVHRSSGYDVGPIIVITVEFGRRKRDCKGLGICKVGVEWGEPDLVVSNSGWGKAWVENGKLHLDVSRNSLDSGTFNTYFGSGAFKMEEEYALPAEVAAALGVSSYTIKAGNYTITSESGSNTLSLSL